MIDALRPTGRAALASLAILSLLRCTLLVSDLPDPIDTRAHPATGDGQGGASGAGGEDGSPRGGTSAGERGGDSAGGVGSRGGTNSGGANSGGANNGGANNGGDATSGGTTADGGTMGGNPRGGAMTGGAMTGGAMTGGAMTGGAMTGGAMTGGAMTGGAMTGGAMTGGRATGGTTSAGSGGASSGGSGGGAGGGTAGSGKGGAPVDCDRDDDGYTAPGTAGCSGPDCDDRDYDAHPGQQSFFEDQRTSGGFDYDCNGNSEAQYMGALDCSLLSIDDCSGEGFSGSLPACGATGTWIRCRPTVPPLPLLCTSENAGTRRMPCR
jgi:hypothetical protein